MISAQHEKRVRREGHPLLYFLAYEVHRREGHRHEVAVYCNDCLDWVRFLNVFCDVCEVNEGGDF